LARSRADLLAEIARRRAGFLAPLVGVGATTLEAEPIVEGWTAKDLLAHVAAWDELYAERLELLLGGRASEIRAVDLTERNAALTQQRHPWPLDRAVAECVAERRRFLAALARVPDDRELRRSRRMPWTSRSGGRGTIWQWAGWRATHDREHGAHLASWKRRSKPARVVGPKSVLVAALDAGREALIATAALVPASDRERRPICGDWTLKDLLGHVTDWERFGVEALRRRRVEWNDDMEHWNQAHVATRREQPWERVWADLTETRDHLRGLLVALDEDELARPFPNPWDEPDVYGWATIWLSHDRQHADDLRAGLRSMAV
jgi:hypothetical protein